MPIDWKAAESAQRLTAVVMIAHNIKRVRLYYGIVVSLILIVSLAELQPNGRALRTRSNI